jgi:hypothetical protein
LELMLFILPKDRYSSNIFTYSPQAAFICGEYSKRHMRIFRKQDDLLLSREKSLGADWVIVDGLGFSTAQKRVVFYIGLIVFGLIICAPTILFEADPIAATEIAIERLSWVTVLLVVLTLVAALPIVHEGFHLILHPDIGRSDSSILGIDIAMIFVIYDGPMSKRRMVLCLLAPLVGITIFLALAMLIVPVLWPIWTLLFANHIAMCSGDIFLTWRLLTSRQDFSEVWNCGTALMARQHKGVCVSGQ